MGFPRVSLTLLTVITILLGARPSAVAADPPAMVVIEAGRVITATGQEYSPGTVVIEDGEIVLVGTRLEYPASAEVIEARDLTVMPGLTHSQTRLDLAPYRRAGSKAGAQVAHEIYPSEIDFDRLVEHGFLYAAFSPAGTGIPGRAAVYRTAGADGPTLVNDSAYVRVVVGTGSGRRDLERALKGAEAAIAARTKAKEEWDKKQAEAKKKAEEAKKKAAASKESDKSKGAPDGPPSPPAEFVPPKIDPNLQPFVDRLDGKEQDFIFELTNATGYLNLEAVLEEFEEFDGPLFLNQGFRGADYEHVLDRLAVTKPLTVVVPGLSRRSHTINLYSPALDFHTAGCSVAFRPNGDSTTALRDYLSLVGNVAREGLGRDAAFAAVTVEAAKILGLDDTIGTIEKGKRADLIFLDGDPLVSGTKVKRAMIGGTVVWEAKK